VTPAGPRGPIVIDTDVLSADLVPGSRLAARYAPIITGQPAFISFQTVAELLYGALRRGWGTTRMLKLEAKIQRVDVVHTGPELVHICAQLRAGCEAAGHALGQREHNATGGSLPRRFVSACRSSPTTRSSAACPASHSNPRPDQTSDQTSSPSGSGAERGVRSKDARRCCYAIRGVKRGWQHVADSRRLRRFSVRTIP
jgi:hypothetical protein